MKYSIVQMRQALADVDEKFADHPDVRLVGIGEKHTGGENSRAYAIIIYVTKKEDSPRRKIPKQLKTRHGTIPTDVLELPRDAMTMCNAKLDGADILIDTPGGRTGTLGFISKENSGQGRLFGITNAHVVADTNTSAVGKTIKAMVGGNLEVIGAVSHQTVLRDDGTINKPDVALIALNAKGVAFAQTYQIEAWSNQPIQGVSSLSAAPTAGARQVHEYASKATGQLDIVPGTSPFEVTNLAMIAPDTGRPITFERAFHAKVSGFVQGGHSGSAVTRVASSGLSRFLCGMVVGGRANDVFAFAWSDVAKTIRNEFGVDL